GGDGTISGQATTVGSYTFSVVVTDASASTDSASFALDVSPFAAQVTLLHWGDGWTGETYPLSSVGGGSTTFTLVQNGSGGSVTGASPSLGTATFVAGSSPGTDVIRASSSGGQSQDLTVVVFKNPVAQMTGRFSSTDVWFCRFDGK